MAVIVVLTACASANPQVPNQGASAAVIGGAHHDAWGTKKAIPTAVMCSGAVAIGSKIYVVGGIDSSLTIVGDNQIYDTTKNTWSMGQAMPTARWCLGVTAVNGILYAIGGNTTISGITDVVEAYDPATDSWTEKATLPIDDSPVAVTDGKFVLRDRWLQQCIGTLGERLPVRSCEERVEQSKIVVDW
jgi:hypothetical protein